MKVLLINGSPHANGCTNRALTEVAGALNSEGIETEILQVGINTIHGCKGCGMCRRNKLGCCIFGDDIVNVAIKKMRECDGLIIGSPVHYAGAAGDITSFCDRFFYATGGFPGKPAAAIVSCRRAGSLTAFDQLNKYFTINNMPVVPSLYWNNVFGNTPAEVEQDKEGLKVMRTLGRNMAYMIKAFAIAKENGLEFPADEPHVFTNFIRKIEPEHKDPSPYYKEYNKTNPDYKEED